MSDREDLPVGDKKKSASQKALTGIACVLAACLLFGAGFLTARLSQDSGLRSLLWFKEQIQEEYYKDISDEEFWDAAIGGVEGILDDYSCYYSAEEYDAVLTSDKGIMSGCGLSFFRNTNKVYHVAIGSPAFSARGEEGERAEAGMYLTGVGKTADSIGDTFDISTVREALSGVPAGETRYLRLSGSSSSDTRECIVLPVRFAEYTESYLLYATSEGTYAEIFDGNAENGVWQRVGEGMQELSDKEAYLQLVQFSGNAAEEFEKAVRQYKSDGCDTLLLDLRNDGGGSLAILQKIASYLMKDADGRSVVLYSEGKEKKKYLSQSDEYDNYFADSRIYVAANGNTASASEALMGAMLCYSTISFEDIYLMRTPAVAEGSPAKTYGKGIMQTTWRNSVTGEAAKLTTARIYWPDGKTCIQDRGITSDDGTKVIACNSDAVYKDPALSEILSDIRAR